MPDRPPQRTKTNRPAESKQIMQQRTDQLNQITEVISSIEARQRKLNKQYQQLALLDSVSLGLYDEIDKLTKKAPAETITDLALEQVNDVIRETKELLANDTYVQRLKEFVPAGDNPQHRDVVVVLRQVRQGLDRFQKPIKPLLDDLIHRLNEAKIINVAVNLSLSGNNSISREDFEDYDVRLDLFTPWITSEYPKVFNFNKLDNIDIHRYFAEVLQE